jgi:Cu2+-exporting ATPase
MTVVDCDLSGYVGLAPNGEARVELLVRGARCAACLSKIETAAAALPGVRAARLNLTTGKLTVAYDGGRPDPAAVIGALDTAGYGATLFDPEAAIEARDVEGRRLTLSLGVAGFGAGNVMMFSVPVWAGLFGQELTPGARALMIWLSAIIAAPCALYAGMIFFRSAWASLRRGRANMDVPISIGVILTLVVSFSETLQGGRHAYFDAAVTLVFLLLIGRWLDHRLRARALDAARGLLALQAPIAIRLDEAGVAHGVPVARVGVGDRVAVAHGVPVARVGVGDRVAVAPGGRIPLDGVVLGGESRLDNALITGETTPWPVAAGSSVRAGALNLDGRLVVQVAARSEDSVLAAIARLMEAGAQSRSAYVRLADRAAAIYVPVVHSLALATFVGVWVVGLGPREALLRAAAVLIITCPCALGLAVPAVQIAASGRLFRKGILVKSGAALERLAEIDTVVLDKTGVLTAGRPDVIAPNAASLALAAPLARASRHPLAVSLARRAGPGPACESAREVAGMGVAGLIDGRPARLGRAAFLGLDASRSAESELWFGFEGETAVRFRFADRLRADARDTVAALRRRGLAVEILSGDVEAAVRAAAADVDVADWRAGLTPIEKAARIDGLKAAGRKVLMVGDGLNDAAALARADASMAPGAAIDATQNAADRVFEGEGLMGVVAAIDVARAARARALENFGFSAIYNLLAAPLAVLGLVNPLVAAIAMSASSLAVTLNALRMHWSGRR